MASFEQVVEQRRSTRAFERGREVPISLLRGAFELAARAPSNCNAQPWQVVVASGARRDALSARLLAAARSGRPLDENPTPAFTGVHRRRQVACAVEYYDKLGVARQDKPGRDRAALRNFEFFDAPHVAVLCMDESFGLGVAIDVGAYLQTLLLALEARGVQSCAQASLRGYSTIVSEELELAQELRVLCGVAIGYAVPEAPANRVRQPRGTLHEHVTFVGFEDRD
jgi:hypothetical protein